MSYVKQTVVDGQVISSTLWNKLEKALDETFDVLEEMNLYRTSIDSNGIYTVVTYKRNDASTYMTSTLSGGTSPCYTTRTERYYDTDGVTLLKTMTFTITYDSNNMPINEVGVKS